MSRDSRSKREPLVLDVREFHVPTRLAGQRFSQAQLEFWANTAQEALDGATPWEAARSSDDLDRILQTEQTLMVQAPDLARLRHEVVMRTAAPGDRLVEAYLCSGGLLNVFNEQPTDEDDDRWQELAVAQAEGQDLPGAEHRDLVSRELDQLWNRLPNTVMANLTPAQVWAGGGEVEGDLLYTFFREYTEESELGPFESRGDLVRASLIYLRRWQCVPRVELGYRTPMEVVVVERDEILARKATLLDIPVESLMAGGTMEKRIRRREQERQIDLPFEGPRGTR